MNPFKLAIQVATSGGSQIFLGAPWITFSLRVTPASLRKRIALEWLATSPHYFFRTKDNSTLRRGDFLKSEWIRNTESRQHLIEKIVGPHVKAGFTVLDYGCGPGFLAAQASRIAERVIACDISIGVLECAQVLNGNSNINYVAVSKDGQIDVRDESVDLAYSFAVIQHVEDKIFHAILNELHRTLKPGSVALIHVVLAGQEGWRSENDWREDRSIAGRAKWMVGLHCFAREAESVIAAGRSAGFCNINLEPVHSSGLSDDIAKQHLLTVTKP